MKLYDPIISDILTLCQNSTARNLPVCSVDWPDLGKENLIFRQDMAYELGGSGHGLFALGATAVTDDPALVPEDGIVLIGKDQVQMREDLLKNAQFGVETAVQMGETIGYAKKN